MKKQFYPQLLNWLSLLLLAGHLQSFSQTPFTLDSCYVWAKANYPLIQQFDLIEKSKGYNLDNASRGKLPQIILAGQASYQSDVTSVPIDLPNVDIPTPGKDQYKLYGEVSQSINDLYTVKDKSALVEANANVEHQKIEVELYKLKDRINQIYFGILLLEAQIEQTALLKKDIQITLDKTFSAIANGTQIQSTASLLEAELLKADQKNIELKAGKRAYLEMLSLFIRRPLDKDIRLTRPAPPTLANGINRPELKLYDLQRLPFELQSKLLRIENLPGLSVFLQAGVGKPALNVLSEKFDPYYIGGLRVSWNLSGKYTYRNDTQLLTLQQQTVDQQRQTFLFNTNLTISQYTAEIDKLQQLIVTDYDIIALRESVSNTTKVQLDNGTATANDYITNLNATDQARQNLAIHEIQLLQNQINYLTTSGQ